MRETVFQVLVRRARGNLTQEEFAKAGPFSKGTVANWEQGKVRPSPHHLERIGELVPALRPEVDRLIGEYRWHPKRIERVGGLRVPEDLAARIAAVARNKPIDTVTALRQIIEAGLQQFTPSAEAGTGPSTEEDPTAEAREKSLALQRSLEARRDRRRSAVHRKKQAS